MEPDSFCGAEDSEQQWCWFCGDLQHICNTGQFFGLVPLDKLEYGGYMIMGDAVHFV